MRIGIDALPACSEWGGLTTYVRQIIKHLTQIDTENHYVLFTERGGHVPFIQKDHLFIKELNKNPNIPNFYKARVVWDQEHIGSALAEEGVDLYFGPVFMAPLKRNCPAVVTVHDLIFLTHPEFSPLGNREYYGKWGKLSAESAQGIIANSQNTKKMIIRHWQIPEDMITVTPLAAGKEFQPITDEKKIAAVRQKYGLGDEFILYVGGTFPRKNLSTLLKAYGLIPANMRRKNRLVILTGNASDWGKESVSELINSANLDADIIKDIVIVDFVSKDDLVTLYNAATIFVYPSIIEGFGLPPLEAMSCGTPVITSNVPAMNEVIGDAGVLINPMDTSEISRALEKLLRSPSLREELSYKGLERSKDFSWKKTASSTLEAFKRAKEMNNAGYKNR